MRSFPILLSSNFLGTELWPQNSGYSSAIFPLPFLPSSTFPMTFLVIFTPSSFAGLTSLPSPALKYAILLEIVPSPQTAYPPSPLWPVPPKATSPPSPRILPPFFKTRAFPPLDVVADVPPP